MPLGLLLSYGPLLGLLALQASSYHLLAVLYKFVLYYYHQKMVERLVYFMQHFPVICVKVREIEIKS